MKYGENFYYHYKVLNISYGESKLVLQMRSSESNEIIYDMNIPDSGFMESIYEQYMVIALISVNIVPSWDIEGRELVSARRYPNEKHYSPISA